MQKINNRGIGHLLALAVIVLGFSTFGSYQLVAERSRLNGGPQPKLELSSGARFDGTPEGEHANLQVKTNDVVIIKSTVQSTNVVTAQKLVLKNSLPSGLSFVPGSLTIDGVANSGKPSSVKLSDLKLRGHHDVVFKAKVTATSKACGTKKLTNNVSVSSGRFTAVKKAVVLDVCPPARANFELNAVSYVGDPAGAHLTTDAKTGDIVVITATVINREKSVQTDNITFRNTLPKGLVAVPGSLTVNGKPTKGLISKLTLPGLGPQAGRDFHDISFKAKITATPKACTSENTLKLTNRATVVSDGVPVKITENYINVCPANPQPATPKPTTPTVKPQRSMSIQFGTHGAGQQTIVMLPEAVFQKDDTVEFQAIVKNTGALEISKPAVSFLNVSNSRFTVVQDSIKVDGVNKIQYTRNAIRMENLPAGAQRTITFRATIKPNVTACNAQAIKATAKVTAPKVKTQTSTAKIHICPAN